MVRPGIGLRMVALALAATAMGCNGHAPMLAPSVVLGPATATNARSAQPVTPPTAAQRAQSGTPVRAIIPPTPPVPTGQPFPPSPHHWPCTANPAAC